MSLSHTVKEPPRVMLSLWRGLIAVPVSAPTVAEIQEEVARYFRLSKLDMVSERKARAVARPRQIAMWLCKRLTARSLPDIGRRFGDRDHTTVIHAVRRVEELRETDTDVDIACEALLARLGRAPE